LKVLLINGSPRNKRSASESILTALQERLGQGCECVSYIAVRQSKREALESAAGCHAIVFAFPLYVDGIPSHLLRLLDEIQDDIAQAAPDAIVYAVVNNGFYEGGQNVLALEMMRHFCDASNLRFGQGLGVGGGAMIRSARIGYGTMKRLGNALTLLAENILNGKTAGDYLFEPNLPKFLYRLAADMGWKKQAKKRGLRKEQLYAKQ
jgi:multimeric flavodoxin WrbA